MNKVIMEYLIGLVIAGIIFGVYYFIGKAISKKIFYGSTFKNFLGTIVLFISTLIIISVISGLSIEKIFRTREAYFYYAAIVFGSYYGLKNSEVVDESEIHQNINN